MSTLLSPKDDDPSPLEGLFYDLGENFVDRVDSAVAAVPCAPFGISANGDGMAYGYGGEVLPYI